MVQSVAMVSTKTTVLCVLTILLLVVNGNQANKKKNEEIQKKCDTCRELAKSFKEGMERTARYNFAGGDTDWEEKKLGKYSTSETRLIEIVEHLCTKDKFECNTMLEHNEEVLEKWWREYQTEHPDLLQWLCIDTLTICCPDNHFGPECQECRGGVERPCKGNGKCSGGGTRGGTGKCKCNGGYKGELCDVCKNGFYTEMTNETHTVCTACDDSCASTCTQAGPLGCKKCKGGYEMIPDTGCQDIDECNQDVPPCQENEYCLNSPGSYKCSSCHIACEKCIGEGPESCVKCKKGFQMEGTTCKDIDECLTDETCNKEHMFCKNIPGNFICECEDGYLQTADACVPESILERKETSQEPMLSLKDGEAPPVEVTHEEEDSTTAEGGETSSKESERRETVETVSSSVESVEQILGEETNSNEQPKQEL